MVSQIFVNLPVSDLQRSIKFYEALGFSFNPQFTDEKAGCLVLGDNIFAMLLTREFFGGFINKPVGDPAAATSVINCVAVESRAKVDEIVAKAVKAGGASPMQPADHGWMYQHGFQDPDGHVWEVMYGDMSQLPQE
ncbi:VOC family protein [Chitinophaga lutea]